MGKKLGMTQVFDDHGNLHAASVVEAGPCTIVNVKTAEHNGYNAVCLGFGKVSDKKLNKPMLGQFKKINLQPMKCLQEYRIEKTNGFEIGQSVALKERFNAGDYVDICGISKGKGFAGVMKRHGFKGLPASHGASDKERSPGSISSQRSLGRVIPGQKMPGHMGQRKVTTAKIEILKIDLEKNLVYLGGSVPGTKGTLVTIKETTKPKKKRVIVSAKSKKSKKARK
jgi:large subunit ribosomal protein L3